MSIVTGQDIARINVRVPVMHGYLSISLVDNGLRSMHVVKSVRLGITQVDWVLQMRSVTDTR